MNAFVHSGKTCSILLSNRSMSPACQYTSYFLQSGTLHIFYIQFRLICFDAFLIVILQQVFVGVMLQKVNTKLADEKYQTFDEVKSNVNALTCIMYSRAKACAHTQ